eukprot:m.51821 g.51821  ORF g.51821 m.51821 type:complete len:190 (-) comp11263_c1_seq2:176-745(-)
MVEQLNYRFFRLALDKSADAGVNLREWLSQRLKQLAGIEVDQWSVDFIKYPQAPHSTSAEPFVTIRFSHDRDFLYGVPQEGSTVTPIGLEFSKVLMQLLQLHKTKAKRIDFKGNCAMCGPNLFVSFVTLKPHTAWIQVLAKTCVEEEEVDALVSSFVGDAAIELMRGRVDQKEIWLPRAQAFAKAVNSD